MSSSPKTRPITASGVARCSSVMPLTSTSVFAIPTTASAATATAVAGTRPSATSGRPHSSIPSANAGASLRRPVSDADAAMPTMPPIPTAELSRPSPASPRPSRSSATAASRTVSAPSTNVCAAKKPSSRRTRPSLRTAPIPSVTWASSPGSASAASRVRGVSWMRDTSSADHSSVPAVTNSTTAVLETASSRPASAGPAKKLVLSIPFDTTFAAVSCSGRSARLGSSADFAGSNAVATIPLSPDASSTRMYGASARTSRPMPATITTRIRSAATITRTRG